MPSGQSFEQFHPSYHAQLLLVIELSLYAPHLQTSLTSLTPNTCPLQRCPAALASSCNDDGAIQGQKDKKRRSDKEKGSSTDGTVKGEESLLDCSDKRLQRQFNAVFNGVSMIPVIALTNLPYTRPLTTCV